MYPAVLVLSYGNVCPTEIVENILSEMNQPKMFTTVTHDSSVVPYYKCDIQTKYYNNTIHLIPFDGKCDKVPAEILKITEALIVYFDPKDKSFVNFLPDLTNFYKNNDVQLGFLITTSFSDCSDEISYESLKERTNFLFDIVTLKDDAEEQSVGHNQNKCYSEIVEGLNNFVWSNVRLKSSNSSQGDPGNTDELEKKLNDFENLLISAQSLRSESLDRNEFLNKAEELADAMSTILYDNDSD